MKQNTLVGLLVVTGIIMSLTILAGLMLAIGVIEMLKLDARQLSAIVCGGPIILAAIGVLLWEALKSVPSN